MESTSLPKRTESEHDDIDEDIDYGDDKDDNTPFVGWMTFKCFGPKAPEKYRSLLIELGDINFGAAKNEAGRAFMRGVDHREGEANSGMRKRGASIPTSNDVVEATIAQSEAELAQRRKGDEMMALSTLISSCNKLIASNILLLSLHTTGSKEHADQLQDIKKVQDELRKYKGQLEEFMSSDKKQRAI
jgi:hypothetical protein